MNHLGHALAVCLLAGCATQTVDVSGFKRQSDMEECRAYAREYQDFATGLHRCLWAKGYEPTVETP